MTDLQDVGRAVACQVLEGQKAPKALPRAPRRCRQLTECELDPGRVAHHLAERVDALRLAGQQMTARPASMLACHGMPRSANKVNTVSCTSCTSGSRDRGADFAGRQKPRGGPTAWPPLSTTPRRPGPCPGRRRSALPGRGLRFLMVVPGHLRQFGCARCRSNLNASANPAPLPSGPCG